MSKLAILALLVVCHFAVAVAHVCDCADRLPSMSIYQWLVAGAYSVISIRSVVVFVRHLISDEPTASSGGENELD